MIIEISKHGLNFGEDLEYIATYIKGKGKSKTPIVERYRILTKGIKSGKERMLFFDARGEFFGRKSSYSMTYVDDLKHISPDQLKFKSYNYYKLGYDLNTVDEFFTAYINSDPMVSVGGYLHSFVTTIKNYTWTYRFNNKSY